MDRASLLLTGLTALHNIRTVVHFWAPSFKWGISLANIADFNRPAELISVPQQLGKVCEFQPQFHM
jgi:hypothetical protein